MTRQTHAQTLQLAELREEMAIYVAQRMGLTSDDVMRHVQCAVDYLQQERGGTLIYVAAPAKTYPVDAIRAAIARGMSERAACRKFRLHSKTLRRLLAA